MIDNVLSNKFKQDASSNINSTDLFKAVKECDWDTALVFIVSACQYMVEVQINMEISLI